MSRRSIAAVIVCFSLFSIVLTSHHSQHGEVFARYSIGYFIFLLSYFTGLILSVIVFFIINGIRVTIQQNSRRLVEFPIIYFVEKHFTKLLLVAFLWFCLGVFYLFPPQKFFSNQPILQIDYAHHYHQVSTVVKALTQYGKHWAYDPSFAAGYPEGTLFDVDMKLFEVIVFCLTKLGISLASAYNGVIIAYFLFVPILLYFTGKNFGFSKPGIFLVVLSGSLLWLSDDLILTFNVSGMASFVFGSYWALFCVSWFYRFLQDENITSFLFFLVTFVLSFTTHILLPFILVIPMSVLYVYSLKKIKISSHILILFSCFVALLVNSWWIVTVLRFLPYRTETPFWGTSISNTISSVLDMAYDPRSILIILGLWGFYTLIPTHKVFAILGLSSVIWFVLLGKFGSNLPLIYTLEPGRFLIPARVFSILGTILGIQGTLSEIKSQPIDLRKWFPLLAFPLLLILNLLTPPWAKGDRWQREYGVIEQLKPLVIWINENTTQDARIAFQDISPGSLTGAKLSYLTDRELIGGPFSAMNLKHNYANFTAKNFFDKNISDLTTNEFIRYCKLYNIKWIISSDEITSYIIASFAPNVRKVKKIEGKKINGVATTFVIYEVNIQPDYFLHGSGSLNAELNKITVRNASSGEIILKYHWFETLAVTPLLPIEKYEIEGSQIGFIKVINNETKDFVIYNTYEPNPNSPQAFYDNLLRTFDILGLSY